MAPHQEVHSILSSSARRRLRHKNSGGRQDQVEIESILKRLSVLEARLAENHQVAETESEPEHECSNVSMVSREELFSWRPVVTPALKSESQGRFHSDVDCSRIVVGLPRSFDNPGVVSSVAESVAGLEELLEHLQEKLYAPATDYHHVVPPGLCELLSAVPEECHDSPRNVSTLSPVLDDDLDCEPHAAEVAAIANPLLIELPVKVDEIAESLWYLQRLGCMDTYEFEEWVYQREVSRLEEEYRGKPFLGTDEELSILADYGDVWNHFGDDDDDDLSFR